MAGLGMGHKFVLQFGKFHNKKHQHFYFEKVKEIVFSNMGS